MTSLDPTSEAKLREALSAGLGDALDVPLDKSCPSSTGVSAFAAVIGYDYRPQTAWTQRDRNYTRYCIQYTVRPREAVDRPVETFVHLRGDLAMRGRPPGLVNVEHRQKSK